MGNSDYALLFTGQIVEIATIVEGMVGRTIIKPDGGVVYFNEVRHMSDDLEELIDMGGVVL